MARGFKNNCLLKWQWEFRERRDDGAGLCHELGLNPLLALVMAARGYSDPAEAQAFLEPSIRASRDPSDLKDMDRAVERLVRAINNNEHVWVYGDYDVDGITATVMLLRFFKWLGKKADYYIPNRLTEGYGLNRSAIDRIAAAGAQLLITVDNGISSIEEVRHARQLGMDVLITDHHQSGDSLPEASAVVNPNRADALYDAAPLAGVGVAFKLIHATARGLGIPADKARSFLMGMLDLVALGTVADIVPLIGENRIFVREGLKRLKNTDKVGLKTLLDLAWGRDREVCSEAVSFSLAPRMNAAGRHDKAPLCVDLLMTEDSLKAVELTRQLNHLNDERRKLEADILESCLSFIDQRLETEQEDVIVIQGEGWHIGVVGIVASRILERYYRPVIVLAVDRNVARGSGRSIRGFDLHEALSVCRAHLMEYGGHKRAVGLTLRADDVPAFRRAINAYAAEKMDPAIMHPHLTIDAEISEGLLTLENIESLAALEPLGAGNPAPVFVLRNARLLEMPRTVGKNHVKMTILAGDMALPAIGFSMLGRYPEIDDPNAVFHIAFTPFINEWKGRRKVEVEIKDLSFDNIDALPAAPQEALFEPEEEPEFP